MLLLLVTIEDGKKFFLCSRDVFFDSHSNIQTLSPCMNNINNELRLYRHRYKSVHQNLFSKKPIKKKTFHKNRWPFSLFFTCLWMAWKIIINSKCKRKNIKFGHFNNFLKISPRKRMVNCCCESCNRGWRVEICNRNWVGFFLIRL